jgi:2-polyprenyl-3-methyl-5-hydroxy-6-metoxy-1,4-benzoquinol methylase
LKNTRSKDITDWTAYYSKVASYTKITRRISIGQILKVFKQNINLEDLKICEIGGGNSFILHDIIKAFNVERYHVIDFNALGLQLLKAQVHNLPITLENCNVLDEFKGTEKYDLVFSVGLIEHFDVGNTKKAIEAHFQRCVPGGFVFISFPTPTLLYRIIRNSAEVLGIWKFPDERPLSFKEVKSTMSEHGVIKHEYINWLIGLTQGYLLAQKQ